MILKEYSLPEKAKIVNLVNYLQPLVPDDKLSKILDFYKYYDESYYEIEDSAVFYDFFSHLKNLAKENGIELPKELT